MSTSPCLAAALAFLVIGACVASPLSPIVEWFGRATAHFTIFTKGSDPGGDELLGRLETARLFFKGVGWAARDLKLPLSIVAFPSPKEFEAYRFNPAAFAFYQRTHHGDFVLMRALEPEHYSVAIHEYTHFVVEHSGLKLPLWLNEGLADFYSTVQYKKAESVLGLPPGGRMDNLRSRSWLDWSALATVDRSSPYYHQQDKMLAFYAQSWALVHVLALDPAYSSKFQSFLLAITESANSEDAILTTFHKSLQEIGHEVEEDVKNQRMEPVGINVDIRPGALETAPVADSDKLAEYALADVQAADPNSQSEAKAHFAVLATRYPDDPHSEESLGFLAMRYGAKAEAEQHFTRAVKAHSQDPEVLFTLAHLRLLRDDSGEDVMGLLKRAVAADGTYYNALLELGFTAAKNEDFDLAVETLSKIKEPKKEHLYAVMYNLAYCFSELHQSSKARPYAEQSIKQATNTQDREEAQSLLRFITQESRREVATYE